MSCCRDLNCQFDERVAEREMRRLERKGPLPTTTMLVEDLAAPGIEGEVLLDEGRAGGGPGGVAPSRRAEGDVRGRRRGLQPSRT